MSEVYVISNLLINRLCTKSIFVKLVFGTLKTFVHGNTILSHHWMSPSKTIEMSSPKGTNGSSIMKAGNSSYVVEGKGDPYPMMIIRQDI